MSIDTVNDLPPRVQYVATASQTVFPYPFPIFQNADLVVDVNGTVQTLTTNYTVSGAGDDTGGNVTFTTGRTAGDIVTIYRQTVIERDSDFQLNGPMFSTSVNDEFDKLVIIAQELRSQMRRCLRIPNNAEVIDADIELAPTVSWASKYLAFDANGKPEPAVLVAGTISPSVIGGILYPITPTEALANITPLSLIYESGNVLRFSADPTGVSDVSPAFNLATFATYGSWVPTTRPHLTTVPPGKYKPLNTVYVRSGGAVKGAGMATYIDASGFGAVADNVFQMGWGNIAGTPTLDSGGYPPEISNMFFNGGPSGGGACVHQSFPGGLIHDLWFAAPGLGVYLAGGYLYDCEFDLGLTGVKVGPSTNQTISNCRFFNPNFCIEFDVGSTDIVDMIISGCTFEYPKFAAISIGTGTGRVRNLKVSDCIFTNNADYGTYIALLYLVNAGLQVTFENCTFRNWKNYSAQIATSGGTVTFLSCIWDGEPTHSSFTASTTSKGIDFSLGNLIIRNCVVRNLDGNFIDFSGAAEAHLEIDGLTYKTLTGATAVVNITNTHTSSSFKAKNITGDGLTKFINNQSVVPIQIKNATNWYGAVANASSRDYVLVPYQQSSLYQITLLANQNAGGSGNYRKSSTVFAQKDNDFTGTARSYINQVTAIEGAAHTNPVLDIDVEFASVGGGVDIASSNSGSIAISWPDSYSFEHLDVQLLVSG